MFPGMLQVAALKKVGKGTKLVLLDRYGPAARTVAKELSRKGYSKVSRRRMRGFLALIRSNNLQHAL